MKREFSSPNKRECISDFGLHAAQERTLSSERKSRNPAVIGENEDGLLARLSHLNLELVEVRGVERSLQFRIASPYNKDTFIGR